jgi:hypothetical protein
MFHGPASQALPGESAFGMASFLADGSCTPAPIPFTPASSHGINHLHAPKLAIPKSAAIVGARRDFFMPSEAKARADAPAGSVRNLEFYRTRDDVMRAYQPVNDEERLLAAQIVRAWQHLQRMYELESQVLESKTLYDLFTNDLDRYKLLTRGLAEAERMWRYAVVEFQRARRRREARDLGSVRRASRPAAPPPRTETASAAPVTESLSRQNFGNLDRPSARPHISACEPPPQAQAPPAGS